MAERTPLKLRRQKGSEPKKFSHGSGNFQVEVLVNTGIFHLDQAFSYFIPEELEPTIEIGSIVKVPFRNNLKIGVVISKVIIGKASLKPVHSLVSRICLSKEYLQFSKSVSERYLVSRPAILASSFPIFTKELPFISTSDKIKERASKKPIKRFYLLTRSEAIEVELLKVLREDPERRFLVILPTKMEIEALASKLTSEKKKYLELGSHLSSSQRRKNFEALSSDINLIIGTRSAILAPMQSIDEILVLDESVEHYQELKAPYWNLRDLALLRAEAEGCDLTFISHSISLELARLVDLGWITLKNKRSFLGGYRASIATEPNTYHATIRQGLAVGAVLISVAGRGYANSFSCQRCRNRASCQCGGRLVIDSKKNYSCAICDFSSADWSCSSCQGHQVRIFQGGAEKIVEELGKAFPRVAIFSSTGEKPIKSLEPLPSLVVSTFGVEPEIAGGYSACVLLDGERLLNRPFIRAEEELRYRWFKLAAKVRSSGFIYLSLSSTHPLSQALIGDNVMRAIRGELDERNIVQLPPSARVIQILGEERSISGLKRKLNEQFKELEILTSSDNRRITLKSNHQNAGELLTSLKALQKYRSAAGQELFSIKVDPYNL